VDVCGQYARIVRHWRAFLDVSPCHSAALGFDRATDQVTDQGESRGRSLGYPACPGVQCLQAASDPGGEPSDRFSRFSAGP